MTEKDLELLKESVGRVVRIVCCDGEQMLAKVHFVSDEDGDVIYDLVTTNKESQYEKYDEQPAYRITFDSIDRVEPFHNS